ncbi:DNA-processing protein DprA [Alistipes sp. OttesenSCG-928-B03]|nr:DNA-processing protein DprA [Alistipes sp. OttesenSCG-928-B03]
MIDDIALTLHPNIGPKTAAHLIGCFGSAGAVFNASPDELVGRAQLREDIVRQIARKPYHKEAEKELAFCRKNRIEVIASDSEFYPPMLRECNDYPHVIYYKGEPAALQRRMLSVVGTRRMTSYGQRVCERIIGRLAEMFPDLVIVSGLAFGVDAAAHRTALASGLATVGVLANPLTNISPAQHAMMAEEMARRGGGVMSEYHSQSKDKGVTFVPRNRIIAGMSMGTLVVESPEKGGALITANMAYGYDRCVMAVPGRVGDASSAGTNALLVGKRAQMVCSAEDIARELMWEVADGTAAGSAAGSAAAGKDTAGLSRDAQGLLGCLPDGEAVSLDELMDVTGLSAPELAMLVMELEFDGFLRVLPGKMYERA